MLTSAVPSATFLWPGGAWFSSVSGTYRHVVPRASVYSGTGEDGSGNACGRLAGRASLTRAPQTPLGQGASLLIVQHIPKAI